MTVAEVMKQFKNYWWFILFAVSACKGVKQGKKITRHLTQTTDTIRLKALSGATKSVLEMHYTGAGGMLIRKGQQAIYIDPFFSNPGPLASTLFKKTTPDTSAVQRYFQRAFGKAQDQDGIIKAVLISHAHYDHLMDVPTLWGLKLLDHKNTRFIGSCSMGHYLRGAGIPQSQIEEVDKTEATNDQKIGKRYNLGNPAIRVYPVVNAHAPHTRFFGMSIKFFRGQATKDQWPKKLAGFKEGQTYSFLIDLLDTQGNIDFRVFVQTSSSNPPNGFIPAVLKAQHPIDVAVLGVASYKYVKKYPQELIHHLQPQHVVMVHWENFFEPLDQLKKKPRAVPFNNIRKFVRKVDKLMKELGQKGQWTLPQVDTKLFFIHKEK
ncbi:MAG TPA: hypothetical protein DCS93_07930 [Microscillaceae bacterium]|nr:hypothetical protein [Microscillaceae bacterium]